MRVLVVPGLAGGEAAGRGARGSTASSRRPAPSGASPGCSMCIAMNGDQLEPGQYAVSHEQPQLRGPAGQGRPHVPRRPAHRGGGRRRPGASPTRGRSWLAEEDDDGPVHDPHARASVVLPVERHRHRPDHPGALPQGHRQGRPRREPVRRLALRRRRHAQARLRPQPARRAGRGGPAGRRQLRLRQLARARALGARRLRLPRGHLHLVRRHLPQQRAQERPAARRGRAADARRAPRPASTERPDGRAVTIDLGAADADPARRARRRLPDRRLREDLPARTASTSSATSCASQTEIAAHERQHRL